MNLPSRFAFSRWADLVRTSCGQCNDDRPDEEIDRQQARFVSEFLIDLNASAAYCRAGYAHGDANSAAARLLTNADITAAIAEGKAAQLAANGLTAARVLEELRRVAYANVREYWTDEGSVKRPNILTIEQGAALAGFEVVIKNVAAGDGQTDTIHKFKLWDKVRALELLAKHFALLVDKIEIKDTKAEARVARLVAARKRTT